jgi:hypothetical protein
MTFQAISEHVRPYLPDGNWRLLAEEHQSRLLLKAPFNLNIGRVTLLPLTDVRWEGGEDGRTAPSIERCRLVPVELADYLYDHQNEIPCSWRGKDIVFWSVYENLEQRECPHGDKFACALTYAVGVERWMRLYVPIRSEWTPADMIVVQY